MAETISTRVPVRGRRPSVRAIALAVLLGLMAGFVNGWNLSLVGLLLLVVFFNVRARLFIGVWGVGVALSWLLLPFSYMLGRFVLDSTPVGGIFGLLNENPIVPLFGLDRYTVVGGGILAVVLFAPIYFTVRGWVRGMRARIDSRRKKGSAEEAEWPTLVDPAVPKRRPRRQKHQPDSAPEMVEAPTRLVRRFGTAGLLLGLSMTSAVVYTHAPRQAAMQILNSLADANGAEVTAGQIGLDFWTGRLEIRDLAFADPTNLNEDRVRVDTVVGLVNTAALMCGRLEVDRLRCEGVQCHVARTQTAWGLGGGFPENLASPFDAPMAVSADDQPGFAVCDCVEHWEQVQGCVASLRQVLTAIEHVQDSDHSVASDSQPLPRFAELPAGRSQLGTPRPKAWIRSMVVEGFAPVTGWGSRTAIRFANLSNNAKLCPRATYLEIQNPDQGLNLRASVAQGVRPYRHPIQLRVERLPLAACSLGVFADRGLVCDGGTASVSGAGWIGDQSLELNIVAEDRQLALRLSDEKPVPGLTPEAFDARLDQTCRLRFAARVHGSQFAPKITINPGDVREYVDRRSRLAIDIALAANALPPQATPTPVPVEAAVVSMPQSPLAPGFESAAQVAVTEANIPDTATEDASVGNASMPEPVDAAVAAGDQVNPASSPVENGAVTTAEAQSTELPATGPSETEMASAPVVPASESVLTIAPETTTAGVERLPPIAFPSATLPRDIQPADAVHSSPPFQPLLVQARVTDAHEATPANTASFTFSAPGNQQNPVCGTPFELPKTPASQRPTQNGGYPEIASTKPRSARKTSWWTQRFDEPVDAQATTPSTDVNPAPDAETHADHPATFGQWARSQFARASNAWPFRRKTEPLGDPMAGDTDDVFADELEQPRLVRQPEVPSVDHESESR